MDSANPRSYPPKGWGKRHTHMLLGFLICAVDMALILNMSIAIVPMTTPVQNSTSKVFNWTPKVQGAILSSFYWGNLISQLPSGILVQKYGAKLPLLVSFFTLAVFSLCFPVLTIWGGEYVAFACRLINGFVSGCALPAMMSLIGQWTAQTERDLMSTFCLIGVNTGCAVILIASGYLASTHIGWPLIFYLSGTLSGILGILIALLLYSSPEQHPKISREEMNYIIKNRGSFSNKKPNKVPWKDILKSIPVWTLVVANGGCSWGFVAISAESPSYFKHIMGVDLELNGLASALPYVAFCICAIAFGYIFNALVKCRILSLTASRKIMMCIGLWFGATILIGFTFIPTHNITLGITLLMITLGLHAGPSIGILANIVDIAPNFAGIISPIVYFSANICSSLTPIVFGLIISDKTSKVLWQYSFCLSAGIMIFSNLFLIIFGTADVQKWNNTTEIVDKNEGNAEECQELNTKR